jgi:putative transposase
MSEPTSESWSLPLSTARDVLTQVLRHGAGRLLAQAIEAEVESYLAAQGESHDAQGHRLVVRNGHLPARQIQTGIGPVPVRQPRVRDRRVDEQGRPLRFTSAILPPYLRRTASLEQLIPWLYLKGISSGEMGPALAALLGETPANLSASTVCRLKEIWRQEWEQWSRRSLQGQRYVYLWADGIHFHIRLAEDARACLLVVLGATTEGQKELLAVADGYRESEQGWLDVLRDLRQRGLETAPQLAVGDGALGFWKALRQVYPATREQRCWVHKEANVLSKLPQGQQGPARRKLKEIWMAATRKQATVAFDRFLQDYQAKYPKAAACLSQDRDTLLTFYDFPAEHWAHLRTTNPIESTFATVRLRTDKTKGCGSRQATLTMVFKLCQAAQRHWNLLHGAALLQDVIAGVPFVDGIKAAA